MMHLNVAIMTRTALMAAVTAVAAQIAIPLPFSPVPFTLQVLGVNATRRRALWASFVWGCADLAIIYALGATWLAVVTQLPFAATLAQGVLPFVPFDLIKVALAALVAIAAAPAIASSRA
jgi:biotin transporter BioY